MGSSAKEITLSSPDFPLSAPPRLPCGSETILAQLQVAGVNLFRRLLRQTKLRALILDETVQLAKVLTAFLAIAGEGLLCQ